MSVILPEGLALPGASAFGPAYLSPAWLAQVALGSSSAGCTTPRPELWRWGTPYTLWRRLRGLGTTTAPKATRDLWALGHLLEDEVIVRWSDAHGVPVAHPAPILGAEPWQRASLDAVALDGRLVEAKTRNPWAPDLWDAEAPPHVQVQVLWQMHCTGLDRAVVPVGAYDCAPQIAHRVWALLAPADAADLPAIRRDFADAIGLSVEVYSLDRHEASVRALVGCASAWWDRHVVHGEAPEPTGLEEQILQAVTERPASLTRRVPWNTRLEGAWEGYLAETRAAEVAAERRDRWRLAILDELADAREARRPDGGKVLVAKNGSVRVTPA